METAELENMGRDGGQSAAEAALVLFTLSSFALPAASFLSLDSFFSLALEALLRSPLAPRGECLCWALTATLRRLLAGLLSL